MISCSTCFLNPPFTFATSVLCCPRTLITIRFYFHAYASRAVDFLQHHHISLLQPYIPIHQTIHSLPYLLRHMLCYLCKSFSLHSATSFPLHTCIAPFTLPLCTILLSKILYSICCFRYFLYVLLFLDPILPI